MFKFKYVIDQTTGKKYWISRAILTNDEGPDEGGVDWYEIDLQPLDPVGDEIIGLDLIDYLDGEIHITDRLDPDHRTAPTGEPGHYRTITTALEVQGDTLILPKKSQTVALDSWNPRDEDRPGIIRELWDNYSLRIQGMLVSGRVDRKWEQRYRALIDQVMCGELEDHKCEIQDELVWIWSNWCEDDVPYDDPERMELYQRVLGLGIK